ncbi:MAG: SRPBCC domain-containing protein, partial [Alphaproteobacteria bacterium]|nr:SRPBCC domain-containing protein [Alphaproteobacteria bacterium]
MTDAAIALTEESGGQTLTMTRRFAAPRERVYAAWADGENVARWFGPESVTCTVHEWDARVDGRYSLTMNHA